MKLRIDAAVLREAIASSVAEKTSTDPIFTHALIDTFGLLDMGNLSLLTVNDKEEMQVKVKCYNDECGKTTVSVAELRNALIGLTGDVVLETENNHLALSQASSRGQRKMRLTSLPAEGFPVRDDQLEMMLDINIKTLIDGISSVSYAAAKTDARRYLNSVCVGPEAISGTDGHRLASFKLDDPIDRQFLIPAGSVDRVLKSLRKDDVDHIKLFLNTDGNPLAFAVVGESFLYVTRLIDGQYPDINRVIPHGNPVSIISLNCADMLPVIERDTAMEMTNIEKSVSSFLKLNFKQNIVQINGKAVDDFADCSASNDVVCALDGRYLKEVLKKGGEDDMTWKVFSDKAPYMLDYGRNDIHLIMPMRK